MSPAKAELIRERGDGPPDGVLAEVVWTGEAKSAPARGAVAFVGYAQRSAAITIRPEGQSLTLTLRPTMRTLARVAGILFAACLSVSCQPSVPDDLSGLLDAMGGMDTRVQWAASKKVESLYGTTGLLTALRHPNPGTRARAALWLESHPGQDVQDSLIATSSDLNEHVRMWVAFSLGRIGDARALSCLEVLEHDPSEIVRLKAVKALEQVRARQRADTKA